MLEHRAPDTLKRIGTRLVLLCKQLVLGWLSANLLRQLEAGRAPGHNGS